MQEWADPGCFAKEAFKDPCQDQLNTFTLRIVIAACRAAIPFEGFWSGIELDMAGCRQKALQKFAALEKDFGDLSGNHLPNARRHLGAQVRTAFPQQLQTE